MTADRPILQSVTGEPLKPLDQTDPLWLAEYLWPDVTFYDKQIEIIESAWRDDETYVKAGNMLGKDFVGGFIALAFFLMHHPCKIVTTSVNQDQLDVLWGEMDRFIRTSRQPLSDDMGGPLRINHMDIRKVVNGTVEEDSYLKGIVATSTKRGEGLSGHHQANTLAIIDEASGVSDVSHKMIRAWAKHILVIGNPHECNNFFRRGCRDGSLLAA